ncbi:MAG: hypothetical protein ACRDVE_00615 [Actinocrinis sp.]
MGPEFLPPAQLTPPPKRRNRAVIGTAIGVAYLVLAAGTATAVVVTGSPAPVDVAALASASTSASAGETTSSKPSATPATTSAPPSPSASPSPKSTVTGSVRNGTHRGDLRYFLVPPPGGPSSVQGAPDGTLQDLTAVLVNYGGSSDAKSALQQGGFKKGATRVYQDSALGANVEIDLIQFNSSTGADNWLQGFYLGGSGWTSFSVPGESNAKAREKKADGLDNLIGVYYQGDTFYQITVYGTGSLPHGDLANLMNAEHDRLAHG